ncbi:hypothetical protein SEA_ACOLYTE_68 [Mycobacterium phage Acolyte]|nr:hypothetical protein SEA_ACOLYTE_68 [Mycobacterium phage Acolyte]
MSLIATITLLIALVALWIVRRSWHIAWERPAILIVALQALDILLVTGPVSRCLGPKLYALTGVWNFEELIGHICYMISMFTLLYLVADRLDMTPRQFRFFVRYRIELPATLVIALMVAIFVSKMGDWYVPDTIAAHTTPWSYLYWLTMIAGIAWVLVQVAQVLMILRRDPRSRRAADAYLCAISVSAVCCVAFILALEPLQWLLVRGEVVGYAIAASYSWRSKEAYLRGR